MQAKSVILTLVLSLAAFNAAAEGISIERGKWEMTSVMTMPMLREPRVTTVEECLDKDEITPESMIKDMENPDAECEMSAEVLEGNTMKWTLDCREQMGSSRGEWRATSYGDSMKGSGAITMTVQGQEIVMTMDWEGKRIGDCD
jgi:hypothetical protein